MALVLLAWQSAWPQQMPPAKSPEEDAFEQNCNICHGNPATRAPTRTSLHTMSPNFIVEALTNGIMKAPGSALSPDQRIALAEYLTGKKVGAEVPMAGRCDESKMPPLSLSGPSYNGWGANLENWRYQKDPAISASQLSQLELKWAFGFPGVATVFGQPSIVGGRVYVGTQSGHVYSLDANSGCYHWDYTASTGVRSAITVARISDKEFAFFGDRRGRVYAVDAATGQTVWKVAPDDDGTHVIITGAPVLFAGRLYVPFGAGDDSAALDPKYECCKGGGAVVALDAATGETIWATHTISESTPLGRNAMGTQLWGPSGASVWSAPAIDEKRRVLYVGTGDNHSAPATGTSDAVMAISIDSGQIVWTRQLLAGDMGNPSCFSKANANCPEPHGPDYDVSGPNLVTLDGGKRILTTGQKSGVVWGLDPDDQGRIVWQTRVGKGGALGGVQWGTATDGRLVYAPVSDVAALSVDPLVLDPNKGGGLHALDVGTGSTLWTASPILACGERKACSPAQSAAVTVTPEYVLSGSLDGHVRAYSTKDGSVLWDYDLAKPFTTVNGVQASGGSLDAGGPTVAGGMIFVNSGYGLYGGQSGNVLAAFAPRS